MQEDLAGMLSTVANEFKSMVTVSCKGKRANAKQLREILKLAAQYGDLLAIRIEGEDALQAQRCIVNVLSKISSEQQEESEKPQEDEADAEQYRGTVFCGGTVSGVIHFLKRKQHCMDVEKHRAGDEKERFNAARSQICDKLKKCADAMRETDAGIALIFETQIMVLGEEELGGAVNWLIDIGFSAEDAISRIAQHYQQAAENSGDMLNERMMNVCDLAAWLLHALKGDLQQSGAEMKGKVVAAELISVTQLLSLQQSGVTAVVTKKGSMNSHVTQLASGFDMTYVGALEEEFDSLLAHEGEYVVVDGSTGVIHLAREPLEEQAQSTQQSRRDAKPAISLNGKHIPVLASVGTLEGLQTAIRNGADGIGLLRSELLCTPDMSWETQCFMYRQAASLAGGKCLTIRTFDYTADKMGAHEAPAMGVRGVRGVLQNEQEMYTQLCAILVASVQGEIDIMLPMVSMAEEVRLIRGMMEDIKKELSSQGIPYRDDIKLGVMIETPSSAIISDVLAKESDFFAIGSGDLTQFTMAADRSESRLHAYYDVGNEAVLRLIRFTAMNAHRAGIPVFICGEMQADKQTVQKILQTGVGAISTAMNRIHWMKEIIRETDIGEHTCVALQSVLEDGASESGSSDPVAQVESASICESG